LNEKKLLEQDKKLLKFIKQGGREGAKKDFPDVLLQETTQSGRFDIVVTLGKRL